MPPEDEPEDIHGECAEEIRRLKAQVETEHECAGELQEGLSKQFRESAAELDAKDAEIERLKASWEDMNKQRQQIIREKYSMDLQVRDLKDAFQHAKYCDVAGSSVEFRCDECEKGNRAANGVTENRVGACTRNAVDAEYSTGHTLCLKPLPCPTHDTEKRKNDWCSNCGAVLASEEGRSFPSCSNCA